MDQRQENMTDRLRKRELKRQEELQHRKEEKEKASVAKESVDFFMENFSRTREAIEVGLQSSETVEKNKLNQHFDDLLISVQKLNRFIADSTMFLPSYDIEKAQENVAKLQNSIVEKRDVMVPKKRFTFRSKKKTAEKTDKTQPKESAARKHAEVQITECSFADQSSAVLVKSAEEVRDKDVALARLDDCTVEIHGSPCAAHIFKLNKCRVFLGPVSGSVFIEECADCEFIVACQQLRVHATTETNFYLHVTSRAIIEDCSKVYFAPYNWVYPTLDEDYRLSGLDRSKNSWNEVDDFNWLVSDVHSPNWAVLPEEKRIQSWNI